MPEDSRNSGVAWRVRLAAMGRDLVFSLLRRLAVEPPWPRLQRLGSAYGGWYVPLDLLERDSVVYCAGVGEDITFDRELIGRRGCSVHAFDPTPRAQAYVLAQPDLPAGFRFHAFGLWEADGEARFYAPRDPAHVSHSITNLQGTTEHFVGPVKTLGSVMRELGHDRIDLLKMDIEGAEYAVLRQGLASGLRPGIICVELEAPSPWPNLSILWWLRRRGYRLLKIDGRNLTFLHREFLNRVDRNLQGSST